MSSASIHASQWKCPKNNTICEGKDKNSRYKINTCKMGKNQPFTYRMTGPCTTTADIPKNHFPKVAIIGAGISGLVIAYEMVNAWKRSQTTDTTKLPVKIYEKSNYAGGKIVGYFDKDNRPVEHSTRVYTASYIALFDILKNIPILVIKHQKLDFYQ